VHDLIVDEDLALVGRQHAVDHVHQRGLAGAVLPQQGVDLPTPELEVDGVVGRQGAEALGDAAELEGELRGTGCIRWRHDVRQGTASTGLT
jgi:hypothetical protein